MAIELESIDLYDPDTFAGGVPHETFALMRRHAPVLRQPQPGLDPFWAVTRYRDIVAISRDWATFSAERRSVLQNVTTEEGIALQRLMLLSMDPPRHSKLRALVNKGFTPRMVAQLSPSIRRSCDSIVDAVADRGECDFATEVAAELPLR